MPTMRSLFLATMIVAQPAAAQQAPIPSFGEVQRTDLQSTATGAMHRIWMVQPNGAPPADGFPVLYLLDASWYFGLAVEQAALLMRSGDMPRAVIVGIGYDDPLEARRLRVRDFTTPAPESMYPPNFVAWKAEPGGAERFMKFMEEELKPWVAARTSVAASCQVLFGHSLSGLYAVEALLRHPSAYSTFVIGDPSVWWNNNAPLRAVERVSADAQAGNVILAHSTVPRVGPGIDSLYEKLASRGFAVEQRAFAGDTHNSMIPGFITLALRRGLACS